VSAQSHVNRVSIPPMRQASLLGLLVLAATLSSAQGLELPARWEYSAPLISPEVRDVEPSRAQKDPTVVFHEGRWHVFMTVKLPGRSAIEHCSFERWEDANDCTRTLLAVSDSDYFCAAQVFYFRPDRKWYLVYQMGVEGREMMWVAYSTTTDIADPASCVSHGELIRASNDETLTVDPEDLRFLFQGMLEANKSGKGYGAFSWRLGPLTPKSR